MQSEGHNPHDATKPHQVTVATTDGRGQDGVGGMRYGAEVLEPHQASPSLTRPPGDAEACVTVQRAMIPITPPAKPHAPGRRSNYRVARNGKGALG